jgi:hypothetical protein
VAAAASKRILAASLGLAMLIASTMVSSGADAEEYELSVSIDDAKINLHSGNFSVAITRDWPRVIFKHELDPFSPTFEVSCPRMYLFNDTDGDGIFDPPEAEFTVFLDSNHVNWNLSAFEQDYSSQYGQYVVVGMNASVHTYVVGENETLVVSDWALLSFWFFLAEESVVCECPGGTYVIDGKTQMRMNFTLRLNDYLDVDGVVLEQMLQGGGSTNMFQLVEGFPIGGTTTTGISALVDEREVEADYAHEFRETSDLVQKTRFAKEDGVVQAFYFWETEAMMDGEASNAAALVNSSYFTTGAGMTLHSILPMDNHTTMVSLGSTMGIYESGFIGSVRDWIREYIIAFVIVCGVIVAASLTLAARRLRRKTPRLDDNPGEDESKGS